MLDYICGDALDKRSLPKHPFDTVILSNVLEHIDNRVDFLLNIARIVKPRTFLIRVPSYERDWRVPLQDKLNIDYRLDPTHYLEYTEAVFIKEIVQAGLNIVSLDHKWGEIWSVVKPQKGTT